MKSTLLAMLLVISNSFCVNAQGLVLKHQEVVTTPTGQAIFDPPEPISITPDMSDLDGNGQPDLIVWNNTGISDQETITVLGYPGFVPLWTSPQSIDHNYPTPPLFVDVTGDNIKEVLCYGNPGIWTYGHTVMIYSVVDNALLFALDSSLAGTQNGTSVPPDRQTRFFLADYDGDGIMDITVFVPELNGSGDLMSVRIEIWGAGTVQSSPPSDLVIASQNNDLILNWQPVDSCSMYRVYWSFGLNGNYASVGTSCTTNFTHAGAAIAPLAFYRVVAITSTSEEQVVGQASHRKQEN